LTKTTGLNETGTVVLDASGNGTVQLSPNGSNEHWLPTLASVKASSATNEASCKIYIGQSINDSNFVSGTFTGSSGDASDQVSGFDIWHRGNRYIFAVWAGGDVGATATLTLSGTKEFR